jgi:hypothetical protein
MGTDSLNPRRIFVFGSNKAGRHGKGAALFARQHHGAIYGLGWAMQGNSYAIPTKGYELETLPLQEIQKYVEGFLRFASSPHGRTLVFDVTPIGCGLAGYSPEDIAPFFKNAPENVNLPDEFKKVLDKSV